MLSLIIGIHLRFVWGTMGVLFGLKYKMISAFVVFRLKKSGSEHARKKREVDDSKYIQFN